MNAVCFQIVLKQSVLKDLKRVPSVALGRIQERIASLAVHPFPSDAQKIYGYDHYYRTRVGSYRIVYEVATEIRIVTVVKVGDRKNVYRFL